MNKRKTLRMTSILLALMMFFGMVSVLMVPVGTAGAADENDLIGLDLSGAVVAEEDDAAVKLDSKNVLVKEYDTVAPLMWTKSELDALYDNDFVYNSIKLTLYDPNGNKVKAHTEQPITLKDGVYYYNVPIANTTAWTTGLYTAYLIRYTTNTAGQEAREKLEVRAGAFWLCEVVPDTTASPAGTDWTRGATNKITDNVATSGKTTVGVTDANKTVNYNGPEAEIKVEVEAKGLKGTFASNADKRTLRMVNPYTKTITDSIVGASSSATSITGSAIYTIPKNAVHGRELRYGAMVINHTTNTSAGECIFIPAEEQTATKGKIVDDDLNLVVVDAKAPTIDASAIKLSLGMYPNIAYFTTPMAFSEVVEGYTVFKQMPSIAAPKDTSKDVDGVIRVLQTNKDAVKDANSGVKMNATDTAIDADLKLWQLGAGAATTIPNQTKSAGALLTTSNEIALIQLNANAGGSPLTEGLKNGKLVFSIKDKVGNESTLQTGYINVVQRYNPINRVDAVINEYKMQVGDTVTIKELAEQIKAVPIGINPALPASYPDAWTIGQAVNTAASPTLLDHFDIVYAADNKTIVSLTAKKAGTTSIAAFLTPVDIHQEMDITSNGMVQPMHTYKATDPVHYETALGPQNNNLYFTISEKDEFPVTSVTVAPKTLALEAGKTSQLTATVLPANADDKTVQWYSSNTAIATVDANGLVTAVADGTCQIYARSNVLSGIQDHCEVTVGKKAVDPTPLDPLVGWQDEGGNRYYYVDGQKITGWRKIDGSWYFFDYSNSAMRAGGWLKEGGKWYYLNTNGTMKSAEWFKDNNGKWYWLKANGAMAAGWEKINGTWYYFNASGAMQTGWVNVRGIWYYMKSSGAMAEGWLQDGGSWYYLTPGGGAMVTGRVTINGRASNFATSGRWLGYV